MASFGQLRDTIISITSRPDQAVLIESTINSVIRRMAGSGNYPQALSESVLEDVDVSAGAIQIALPDSFHAISYIKSPDDSIDAYRPIEPARDSSDCYGYYLTGGNVLIRPLSIPADEIMDFLTGFYVYPDKLIADAATNWVLDRLEYLIQEMTISQVLATLGDRHALGELRQYTVLWLQHEVAKAVWPYSTN